MHESIEAPDQSSSAQITIKLHTGRTAVIRELDGLEQTQVDEMIDYEKLTGLPNYRVAAAIVSLGDEKFRPATTVLALRSRLKKLTGRELDQIKTEQAKAFALPEDDESLKKQSDEDET